MIYISEGLLYVCFAILTGSLLLRLVPDNGRPVIHVPPGLLLACALLIPLLSFVPIHQLAQLFAKDFGLSYTDMLKSILLDINAGKAWVWTAVGASGLSLLLGIKTLRNDKHMPKAALFVTILLMFWLGYASHAASLSTFKGLFVHSVHFLAFSVWIGILFVISWFSQDNANWQPFLRWFSPTAIIAVLATLIAGFTLMSFTTPNYINSWMLPYGQMLLLKHLFIIPLLLFAYTNGFGYKRAISKDASFNPKPWLKAESVIALLVLAATAALGQQAPPHNIRETLQSVSPSPLFTNLYKGGFSPDLTLAFRFNTESLLMLVSALIMAFGIVLMHKSNRPVSAFFMGVFTAVFGYFGLMFAIA